MHAAKYRFLLSNILELSFYNVSELIQELLEVPQQFFDWYKDAYAEKIGTSNNILFLLNIDDKIKAILDLYKIVAFKTVSYTKESATQIVLNAQNAPKSAVKSVEVLEKYNLSKQKWEKCKNFFGISV